MYVRRCVRAAAALFLVGQLAIGPLAPAAPPQAASTVAPTVHIDAPADGTSTDAAQMDVVVSASAKPGVKGQLAGNLTAVDLLANGVAIGTRQNSPNVKAARFTFTVDLAPYRGQTVTFQARGWQGNRNGGRVGLSNTVSVTVRAAGGGPVLQQEPINNAARGGGRGSVSLQSGEHIWTQSVAHLPGVGFSLDFVATYRSGNSNDGALGFRWTHSYDQGVESTGVPGASDAVVQDGTGRHDRYLAGGGGAYITPSGFYDRLTYDPANDRFARRDRYGWVRTYARRVGLVYKVTEIADRNDNRLTMSYDAGNRLVSITDTRGQVVQFFYTAEGRIDRLEDWAGRRFSFTYTAEGDLASSTTPAVPEYPAGNRTTFTYATGQAQAWLNHNLLSITDPKGQTFLVNTYDPATDRLVAQRVGAPTQVYHFDYAAGVTRETNRRGFVTEYVFSPAGNPTQVTEPGGFVTRYAYNVHMERTQTVLPRGNSWQWTYDEANADRLAQGNVLEVRRSTGGLSPEPDIVTHSTYEPHFNSPKTHTSARGFTTTNTFDYEAGGPDHGNVVRVDHPLVALGQPAPQAIAEQMSYNARGQITSVTDGEGNVTAYVYYAAPDVQAAFLEKEIVASGAQNLTTRFTYDLVGNWTSQMDPRGNTWTRVVNALNQVKRTIAPAPFGYTVDFAFDPNGNLVQTDMANLDETGAPYPNAVLTTTQTVDILNNVVSESREIDAATAALTTYERDESENVVHRTLPEGNEIHEVYDGRDLVTQTTRGCNCSGLATVTQSWDGNRNLTEVVRGEGGNHKNTYAYDGFDRQVRDTDGLGNHTDMAYDPDSNATATARLSAAGATLARTVNSFDEVDRRFQEDRLFQDSSGAALGDGLATMKYAFDRSSRQTAVTDDNNHTRTQLYDAANRVVKSVDPLGESAGNKVEYLLDANGNPTQVTETEFNQATGLPEVIVTAHGFDELNREVQTTEDPGGFAFVTAMKYDSRNNNTVVTDAEGRTARRAYDGLRRLLSTRFDEGGLNIVVRQTWDRNSRLTSQTDDNGNTTSYAYTTRDLLERKTYADGATESYLYNLDDKLTQVTDPNGSVVTNTYDDADLLAQRDIARGPGVIGTTQELYRYDGRYRRTRAENRDGATPICVCEEFYDTLDRMDREVHTIGANPARTVASRFDGVGNRVSHIYPSGRILAQTFDAADRLMQIAEGATVLAAFLYAGSREARRTYTNGMVKDVTYDSRRRTTLIRHLTTAGLQKSRLEYAYDGVHNRRYERRRELSFEDPDTAQVYRYDGIYQVNGVKFGVPGADLAPGRSFADYATWTSKHEWTFDGVGNRKTMDRNGAVESYNSPGGTYTPDPRNRYFEIAAVTRRHDADGNVVDDGTLLFEYDYKNELMRATRKSDGAVVGAYLYDASGRRVRRSASPAMLDICCGCQPLESFVEATGVRVESHVYGNGIDELLTSDLGATPQRFFFHENALGSILDVTDTSGRVVEDYDYNDIYGKVRFFRCFEGGNGLRTCFETTASFVGNRFLFTGRERDTETGHYYCRARYLEPAAGRFTSPDPMGLDADSLVNDYRYAGNAPVVHADPLGLFTQDDASYAARDQLKQSYAYRAHNATKWYWHEVYNRRIHVENHARQFSPEGWQQTRLNTYCFWRDVYVREPFTIEQWEVRFELLNLDEPDKKVDQWDPGTATFFRGDYYHPVKSMRFFVTLEEPRRKWVFTEIVCCCDLGERWPAGTNPDIHFHKGVRGWRVQPFGCGWSFGIFEWAKVDPDLKEK